MRINTKREWWEGGVRMDVLEMDVGGIAKRLVELRGNRTQEEVANALGISTSALSMYECGERIPRDNIKLRISAYYNEPIHKIFFAHKTHEK